MFIKLVSPNFSDLFEPNLVIERFLDGESYVKIPSLNHCRNKKVLLCHRLFPDQNQSLIELTLLLGALKQVNAEVTLLTPYLPYSRQDKIVQDGEVSAAETICRLLAQSGCSQLITFDCHFLTNPGSNNFVGLPIFNISLAEEIVKHISNQFKDHEFIVVGPDEGARRMVGHQAQVLKKTRGEYKKVKFLERQILHEEKHYGLSGLNVLILDDMIASGSTMKSATVLLKKQGANKVICCATHGLFVGESAQEISSLADAVITADTIPGPYAQISIRPFVESIFLKG